jgi:hypothetical protein
MRLKVSAEIEKPAGKRLSTGLVAADDVIAALPKSHQRDIEERGNELLARVERSSLKVQVEEGYLQAERGELIDGDRARREIQAMKDGWRRPRQ